jgi:hypothetical protein
VLRVVFALATSCIASIIDSNPMPQLARAAQGAKEPLEITYAKEPITSAKTNVAANRLGSRHAAVSGSCFASERRPVATATVHASAFTCSASKGISKPNTYVGLTVKLGYRDTFATVWLDTVEKPSL